MTSVPSTVIDLNDVMPPRVSRERFDLDLIVHRLRDTAEHGAILARIHDVAQEIAVEAGYGDRGWRLVSNVGREGGQAIEHLHYHLLAGRRLSWPPG